VHADPGEQFGGRRRQVAAVAQQRARGDRQRRDRILPLQRRKPCGGHRGRRDRQLLPGEERDQFGVAQAGSGLADDRGAAAGGDRRR